MMSNTIIIGGLVSSIALLIVGQVPPLSAGNSPPWISGTGIAVLGGVVWVILTKTIPKILDTNVEAHKAHAASNEKVASAIDKLSDTQREVISHCATVNARKD